MLTATDRKPKRRDKPPCRHCHDRPVSRARRLCSRCFEAPAVRALYPPRRPADPAADVLLRAALALAERRGNRALTVEALAVEAWGLAKGKFGLKGYESMYPSDKRVGQLVAHRNGPVHRDRHLEPDPGGVGYRLTAAGYERARRLREGVA